MDFVMELKNMSSIYRAMMRQALKITWSAKYLWFFGLFAVILEGDRIVNLVVDKYPRLFESENLANSIRDSYSNDFFSLIFSNIKNFFSSFTLSNTLLMLLFLVIGVFLIWLAIISQSALFSGAYKIYKKQKTNFGDLFKFGNKIFWKTLWLNILARISLAIAWLIVASPFIIVFVKSGSEWSKSAFVITSFIISIIFGLIIYFLLRYSLLFAINSGNGVKEAIKNSWKLFIKNWLVSLEMAILLFLVDFLTVIILFLGMVVIAFPLMFLAIFLEGAGFSGPTSLVIGAMYSIGVLWVIFIAAFSSVFRHSVWAVLFVHITEGEVIPKIVRLIASKSLKALESK
jgi:hypothetical protein